MPITLARHAMATRFEIILEGGNPIALRAAGEEALDEIERLERHLSLFRDTSEIAHVNARAAGRPVRVSPEVFRLLEVAGDLNRETGGAFDITVAPLMRCWGFHGGTGQLPRSEALGQARRCVGMEHVVLDRASWTVRFDQHGVSLDLGAIGKGYALDRAVELLRDAGVTSAFIHAGTSTVAAIGEREDGAPWKVALDFPAWPEPGERSKPAESSGEPLTVLALKDEALSVSGMNQKFFRAGGTVYGHVLDPRTGAPATEAVMSCVVLPSATETDALSTALLVAGLEGAGAIFQVRPNMRALAATKEAGSVRVAAHRIDVAPQFRVKSPFEKPSASD